MAGFNGPAGVCNPGPGGVGSGYGGTPVGPSGAKNLIQIGGAQNTFGVAGTTFGQDANVDINIAHGATPAVVASGSFPAPSVAGQYSFSLQNGVVTCILQRRNPPLFSIVGPTIVSLEGGITFTVRCVADVDDGTGAGVPDGGVTIDDLLYYTDIFGLGDARADVDDGTATGMCDGGVTIDDLLYFLVRFANGC